MECFGPLTILDVFGGPGYASDKRLYFLWSQTEHGNFLHSCRLRENIKQKNFLLGPLLHTQIFSLRKTCLSRKCSCSFFSHSRYEKLPYSILEAYSELCQTFNMELFAKIVCSFRQKFLRKGPS